jgi:hypothetical protein
VKNFEADRRKLIEENEFLKAKVKETEKEISELERKSLQETHFRKSMEL